MYVQCAPCRDGRTTDTSKPALSAADCIACQPGFYRTPDGGCAECKCKAGEYRTEYQCMFGTNDANVACASCKSQCSAGSYINGTCTGNSFVDESTCTACGTAASNACPASLLPQDRKVLPLFIWLF